MIKEQLLDPKQNCFKDECQNIYSDIIEDLVYRSVGVKINDIFVMHEGSIVDILGGKLRFIATTDISWTSYFISQVNSGLLGLSMESIYERRDYMDHLQSYYDEFSGSINTVLLKNTMVKKSLIKSVRKYIKEECDDKYKVMSLNNIDFHIGRYKGGAYYPNMIIEFTVERR
jgi:hypothetical protein